MQVADKPENDLLMIPIGSSVSIGAIFIISGAIVMGTAGGDEYCGIGGRLHRGTPQEVAEQTGVFTRHGIERIARYAFKLAAGRPRKMLASATKSNALQHAMVMWDEVVAGVAKEFPDVELKKYHVDALCARMVTHPHTLDVIVASIRDRLFDLPPDTQVHTGHGDATSIGAESPHLEEWIARGH